MTEEFTQNTENQMTNPDSDQVRDQSQDKPVDKPVSDKLQVDPAKELIRELTGGYTDDPNLFKQHYFNEVLPALSHLDEIAKSQSDQKGEEKPEPKNKTREFYKKIIKKAFDGKSPEEVTEAWAEVFDDLGNTFLTANQKQIELMVSEQVKKRNEVLTARDSFFRQNLDVQPYSELIDRCVERIGDPQIAANMVREMGPDKVHEMLLGEKPLRPYIQTYPQGMPSNVHAMPPRQHIPPARTGGGVPVLPPPSHPLDDLYLEAEKEATKGISGAQDIDDIDKAMDGYLKKVRG